MLSSTLPASFLVSFTGVVQCGIVAPVLCECFQIAVVHETTECLSADAE